MNLSDRRCIPCEGGTVPLFRQRAEELLKEIPGWALSADGKRITRTYPFRNFADALVFANAVGAIAEAEQHHPDLHVKWGSVTIEISTHAIGGLSENDFILAAKIDKSG